jgi:hypothetical protein
MFESQEEKNFAFFKFEDLRIYHKALDYVTFLYENTGGFPEDLRKELLDSAKDIVISIAKGSFRKKDQFANTLLNVRNYIRTCVVYTAIGHKIQAFTDNQAEESKTHLIELSKMLSAFIGSLTKQQNHSVPENTTSDNFDSTEE